MFGLESRQRHTTYKSGTWVPALFRVWLHKLGARLMGIEATWCDLISAMSMSPITAPSNSSLDGVCVLSGFPSGMDAAHVRTGEAPLRGAWWHATWIAAAEEVRRRFG